MNAKNAKKLQKLQTKYQREFVWYLHGEYSVSASDAAFLEEVAATVEFQVTVSLSLQYYEYPFGKRLSYLSYKVSAAPDTHPTATSRGSKPRKGTSR